MSYGTPASPGEVEAFYTHVRRGSAPPPALLADLQRRYRAIGGTSPLRQRTDAQAGALQDALESTCPARFLVFPGARHAPPFIEDAVSAMASEHVGDAVALVLAPHYSTLSVGQYLERANRAAARHGISVHNVQSWHLVSGLIEALAARIEGALGRLSPWRRNDVVVLFTAHSLPARILETDDPYEDQLLQTAKAVAEATGLERWALAWQSAGRTPEPWLGPDIREEIRSLAAHGVKAVIVCPAGFTSDHLEVLYDIDIEAKSVAEESGVELVRTESLNDDPVLMSGLAEIVTKASGT